MCAAYEYSMSCTLVLIKLVYCLFMVFVYGLRAIKSVYTCHFCLIIALPYVTIKIEITGIMFLCFFRNKYYN